MDLQLAIAAGLLTCTHDLRRWEEAAEYHYEGTRPYADAVVAAGRCARSLAILQAYAEEVGGVPSWALRLYLSSGGLRP